MKEQTYKTFVKQSDGSIQYTDYTPDYIITGDTDSAYIDLGAIFPRQDVDVGRVVEFADKLGAQVNALFPAYMRDVFNSNDEQSTIIQTEREVVADKGFFSAKKNYMMHVVNKSGVPKDEDKIMGLAIRKSDTPEIVRTFLKDMIRMVMDKKSYEEIRESIFSFKKKYVSFNLIDVGRPMNMQNLDKYEMKLREHGWKGIPYHARASLFYNSLCDVSDVKIRSGDKIRIIYIKHDEMKYIALPADADILPSFVKKLKVDWTAQWETVEKKIVMYLKPIGYDPESRQRKKLEGLVVF